MLVISTGRIELASGTGSRTASERVWPRHAAPAPQERRTANFEYGTPGTLDTPVFLASIHKPVTATARMQLRDEGGFALDDGVNDPPAFDFVKPCTDIAGLAHQ